jgi:hypothetical protein
MVGIGILFSHKADGQEKMTEAVVPPNANEEKKDKDKGKKKKKRKAWMSHIREGRARP